MIAVKSAETLADLFAAVGEPTRIAVLMTLREGPSAVAPLAERLGAPMVNVSHHLNVLRRANLLTRRKDGRQVIYSINEELLVPEKGTLGRAEVAGWGLTFADRYPAH